MASGWKGMLSVISLFFTVWLGAKFLLPLFSPFLLGLLLALAAEPMVGFLSRRLRVPRPISAGIGVSMTFCFLAMLLLLLFGFLVRELKNLSGVLPDLETAARSGLTLAKAKLLELAEKSPQSLQPLLRENTLALFSDGNALVGRAASYCLGLAGRVLSHVPDSALGLGTAAVSGFMLSAKLPRLRRFLLTRLPKERLRRFLETWKNIKTALGGWLKAQCKLMVLTFFILFPGFVLLRVGKAPLWALAVTAVDAFPVLGTGTVLLPWSLLCFLQGDTGRSLGLLGLYAAVTLTRSAMEPKLLGRHLGLDPLVTLMALYAGFKLWGLAGMIFAPLLVVAAVQVIPGKGMKNGE